MANVLVQDSSLTAIADAIREKNQTTNTYKPAEMGEAIKAIETGGSEGQIDTSWYTTTPSSVSDYLDLSPYADKREDIIAIIFTYYNSDTKYKYVCTYFANNVVAVGNDYYIMQFYTAEAHSPSSTVTWYELRYSDIAYGSGTTGMRFDTSSGALRAYIGTKSGDKTGAFGPNTITIVTKKKEA